MSNQPTAYAAMITISLPGTDQTATASVRLLPDDQVALATGAKRLRDCTLADLRTFVNTWEQEVWQTYQDVNLLALSADEAVTVEVVLIAQAGEQALNNWADQVVILAAENEAAVGETPVASQASPTDSNATEETPPTAVLEATPQLPEVVVSESEPVYEEEATALETREPAQLPPRPQVRIAGQKLPLSRANWAAVDIFIEEPALRQAQAHALSSPSREVAGVLIGPHPEKQPDGRYNVYITDTIIAKYTVMQGASVTYTPESWRYMNDQLWQRYPDESAMIVGWYHTHPGFGIFLSGMDLFIHQNFFTQLWHVALVLDPIGKSSGFFCWDRHRSHVSRYEFPWPTWATTW